MAYSIHSMWHAAVSIVALSQKRDGRGSLLSDLFFYACVFSIMEATLNPVFIHSSISPMYTPRGNVYTDIYYLYLFNFYSFNLYLLSTSQFQLGTV